MKAHSGIFLSWLVLICTLAFGQQDPLTSQYQFTPLAFNPGYAGLNNITTVTFNTRFQWTGLPGSPRTNLLTATTSVFDGNLGLGFMVMNDQLGITSNTEVQASVAYKISTSTRSFSFGLQAGVLNYRQDVDRLNLQVPDDPAFLPGSEQSTKLNIGAGATYMSENLYLSLSVPRLINNKVSADNNIVLTERHFYLVGAYLLDLGLGLKMKPSVLLRGVSGAPLAYDINVSVLLNNQLWLGAFTRNFNTYGLMAQFEFLDAYKVGYSFEVLNRNFSGSFLPTHEIMLSADFALFSHQAVYKRFF